MSTLPPRATSIRIFLADGVPDGLRIVEKSNWTGRAVVVNRSQLDRALAREELSLPGVYVLTGVSDKDGAPRVYVGEADVLRDRIKQHVVGKDFWTRLIAFTSTNEGLNKAHVRYLEARLVGLARNANQWEVENGTQPGPPPLSEADRADAEWFLAEMLVIFPVLGVDAFEAAANQACSTAPGKDEAPTLFLRERGADGRGQEIADGFVVFKDSRARLTEVPSFHDYLRDLRKQLVEREVLVADRESLVFSQDYRFTSPSAAAAVLVGGSSNGRLAWKDARGRTLKALQQARSESSS